MFNLYYKVDSSKLIEGTKGAFAIVDIPKDTKIVQYKGKLITKSVSEKRSDMHKAKGELWIFTLNDTYDIDASVHGNEARFINHSCEPNCQAVNHDDEEVWIESICDIKKGEELTYNYSFDEPDGAFPCLCGSKTCSGWIVKDDYVFKPGEKEALEKEKEEFLKEHPKTRDATHFACEKNKKKE